MAAQWRELASGDKGTVEECYLCGDRRMTRKKVNNVCVDSGLPYRLRMYQHCIAPNEMQAHMDGLVCVTDVRYEQSREVKYMMPGVGSRQNSACTLYSLLTSRTGVKTQVRERLMYELCHIVSRLQQNMVLHRDLHCNNILIDPKLTHITVIDVDLTCFHGSVVGVDANHGTVAGADANSNLQQAWPLQFSAWERKLCASMDSQQLATLLVQVFAWQVLRQDTLLDLKKDVKDLHAFFDFDVNCCTGCGCSNLGPWCSRCEPFIDYFRILYTWPLHLQRPQARSEALMHKMVQFMDARGAAERVQTVFRKACVQAHREPAKWESMFSSSAGRSDYWFGVVESLSKYPPPLVHEVMPELHRRWKVPNVPHNFRLDVTEVQQQAKLVLTFYLHKLDGLAVRYPMTYLSAMFYSLELLHCLQQQRLLSPMQISGAVCMFGFLLVANRGQTCFLQAWRSFFHPQCKVYQSFTIVSELLLDEVPFHVRTELYTLQTLLNWPTLEVNPRVQLPNALKRVFCHDAERAHAVYAVVMYKAMHEQLMAPNRLVYFALNNWNAAIFNRVVEMNMIV